MNQPSMLVVAALVAAVIAVVLSAQRLVAIVALASAALHAAMFFGFIHLRVANFPLSLVIGIGLTASGAVLWVGSSNKLLTTAATIITALGVLQLLTILMR